MTLKEKLRLKRTEYDAHKCRMRDGFTHHCKTTAKEGQVVFFGDSITELLPISDWYGEYSLQSGLELYNRGIGGDSTLGLYRRAKENVLCIKPCAVVILIGTNDLGMGFDTDFLKSNMENILKLFKDECPGCKIILEAIYPVIEGRAGKRKNSDILEANRKYKALAEKLSPDTFFIWMSINKISGFSFSYNSIASAPSLPQAATSISSSDSKIVLSEIATIWSSSTTTILIIYSPLIKSPTILVLKPLF
ncbi:MAG: hypothetical protein IIX36_04525 [Clostridia bacterium]|nr:hypothetical protein [Clostridia bacterium]